MSDKLKMLESLVINAEMRNPRYFNANRLVRNMEAMQDHCAGDASKESTMKTLKSYMERGQADSEARSNEIRTALQELQELRLELRRAIPVTKKEAAPK